MRNLLRLPASLVCMLAAPAFAQIDIGVGSTFDFGNATIDFGCSDLNVAGTASVATGSLTGLRNLAVPSGGTFNAGASQTTLGGDFADGGTFNAGSGSVRIVDACGGGTSQLSGNTSFFVFNASTSNGKQLILPANATQSVANSLTLAGTAGNLLQVRSSSAGQRANLALASGAAQTVSYVAARDNAATGVTIAPGTPAAHNSVDGGNLLNWFNGAINGVTGAVPAPGLRLMGQLLLFACVLLVAWRVSRLRRRQDT